MDIDLIKVPRRLPGAAKIRLTSWAFVERFGLISVRDARTHRIPSTYERTKSVVCSPDLLVQAALFPPALHVP